MLARSHFRSHCSFFFLSSSQWNVRWQLGFAARRVLSRRGDLVTRPQIHLLLHLLLLLALLRVSLDADRHAKAVRDRTLVRREANVSLVSYVLHLCANVHAFGLG